MAGEDGAGIGRFEGADGLEHGDGRRDAGDGVFEVAREGGALVVFEAIGGALDVGDSAGDLHALHAQLATEGGAGDG